MEETNEMIKPYEKTKSRGLVEVASGNQPIILGVRELILLSIAYAISLTLVKLFETIFKRFIGKNLQSEIIYNIIFIIFLIIIATVVFITFKGVH